MPKPLTIDELFEHQMTQCLTKLLSEFEKKPSEFNTEEELMNFVWSNAEEFGRIICNQMTEWSDDWLAEVQSKEA